jgi:AAA15 family ATPase/GTPase
MSESLPKEMPQELKDYVLKQMKGDDEVVSLKTSHTQRNANGKAIAEKIFELDDESEGTQKLVLMSGPIIDVLTNGKILIIDEIEARLHTLLTRKLIKLFNSKTTNPKHAQLIFATHDTNLLSNKLFRRDQIWFVEKDQVCASHLYSLAEIKTAGGKVRNDASFEDDYLQGRYGAIPLLGELRQIFIDSALEDQP